MQCTITNMSPLPRRVWVTVAFPADLVSAFGVECTVTGPNFRAVRGATIGIKTVYRVRAILAGNETVTGTLVDTAHPDAGAFAAHPWVTDDFSANLPLLEAAVDGGVLTAADAPFVNTIIDSSPAHERHFVRQRIPAFGMYCDYWIDVLHNDPVPDIWGKVVWSDRNDGDMWKVFDIIRLTIGEDHVWDFGTRHGILQSGTGPYVSDLIPTDWVVEDGAAMALSGRLLSSGVPGPNPQQDIDDVDGGRGGPAYGVSHDWDGRWLAIKNIPRFGPSYVSQKNSYITTFLSILAAQATERWYWDPVQTIGSPHDPGRAGDVEDFGATKGTYAVVERDPRWIHIGKVAAQKELLRVGQHYENDGTRVQAANYPGGLGVGLVFWGGEMDPRPSISGVQLGKNAVFDNGSWKRTPLTGPRPNPTWDGHDDAHRSNNNIAATIALTDDPLLQQHLELHATLDERMLAVVRNFPGAFGQARSIRVAQGLAHWSSVADSASKSRIDATLDKWIELINGSTYLTVPGPMKVLEPGEPSRASAPIYNPNGSNGTHVYMWQHGIAMIALYAAHKQTGDPRIIPIMQIVAQTFIDACIFFLDGQWWVARLILWHPDGNGSLPPGGLYFVCNNRTTVSVDGPTSTYTLTSGTWSTTPAAGALVFIETYSSAFSQNTGLKQVVSATATSMTVSSTLQTEAAGRTVTIRSAHLQHDSGDGQANQVADGLRVAREIMGSHPALDGAIERYHGPLQNEATERRTAEWWAATDPLDPPDPIASGAGTMPALQGAGVATTPLIVAAAGAGTIPNTFAGAGAATTSFVGTGSGTPALPTATATGTGLYTGAAIGSGLDEILLPVPTATGTGTVTSTRTGSGGGTFVMYGRSLGPQLGGRPRRQGRIRGPIRRRRHFWERRTL